MREGELPVFKETARGEVTTASEMCVRARVCVLIGQTPYMSQPVQNAQCNHNILEPTRGRGGGFHFILLNYFQSQNKSRQWPPIALARPQECVGQCGLQWAGSPERVRLINRACFGGSGGEVAVHLSTFPILICAPPISL